ncbi:MAG: hypothetical protein ACXU7D_00505 [Burkholderiaceae bacterium]
MTSMLCPRQDGAAFNSLVKYWDIVSAEVTRGTPGNGVPPNPAYNTDPPSSMTLIVLGGLT